MKIINIGDVIVHEPIYLWWNNVISRMSEHLWWNIYF